MNVKRTVKITHADVKIFLIRPKVFKSFPPMDRYIKGYHEKVNFARKFSKLIVKKIADTVNFRYFKVSSNIRIIQ